eukprot:m.62137 g.62137  ORF g.62137 m.62137 type:complete len:118 (-) comp11894_c0_seq2:350-703(-)
MSILFILLVPWVRVFVFMNVNWFVVMIALLDTDASVVESSRKLCLGYCDTIPINGTERAILYTSVMARLCQSVVMSSYSYSKDPGNEYLLVTAEPGWRLLSTMLAMSDEDKKAINGQ